MFRKLPKKHRWPQMRHPHSRCQTCCPGLPRLQNRHWAMASWRSAGKPRWPWPLGSERLLRTRLGRRAAGDRTNGPKGPERQFTKPGKPRIFFQVSVSLIINFKERVWAGLRVCRPWCQGSSCISAHGSNRALAHGDGAWLC